MKFVLLFMLYVTAGTSMAQSPSPEQTLDAFHLAASKADFDGYFGLFHPDAVFIGTDATERWDLAAFKAYTKPHFQAGKGWTYTPKARHVKLGADGKVAWFDEILEHARYGTCRDSGVLLKEGEKWKVVQYHLTIPVPNSLALTLVDIISSEQKKSPAKQR